MKREMTLLCMMIVAICSGGVVHSPCTADGGPSVRPEEDGAVDGQVNTTKMLLCGKGLALVQADGQHKNVPLTLKYTLYDGRWWKAASPQTTMRPKPYLCYELQSSDKAVPFTWTVWSGQILGRFNVFNTPEGENILTWIDGESVVCAVISKPNDKQARFKEFVAGGRVDSRASRFSLMGVGLSKRKFVDTNTTGHTASIYVTSAERVGKDGFRIKFTGKDKQKVYSVVTDESDPSGWRVEDE